MSSQEIVVVSGPPASGKSRLLTEFQGYARVNRDTLGGTLKDLPKHLRRTLEEGSRQVVLDNTFPTRESRAGIIAVASEFNLPVRCVHLLTSENDARINAVQRMLDKFGRIIGPEEFGAISRNDPNTFPPIAIQTYFSRYQRPSVKEGFASVEWRRFKRIIPEDFTNKAILLDYDGTLRATLSGRVCPHSPDDIRILPKRREVLLGWMKRGYRLLGISNQGDIARGRLSMEAAIACFERTNSLLDLQIEYHFCPHSPNPVVCYCRKPGPGLGIMLINKYKLDRRKVIMVGDMKSDQEFARNIRVRYQDRSVFFA